MSPRNCCGLRRPKLPEMADPDSSPSDFPREIGSYGGPAPGPLIICIGGMHGNEPAGVVAAQRVLRELGSYNPPFKGQLVALAGNRAALARGCRYISEDFNRIWLPERLSALGSEAAQPRLNTEERECRELLTALGAALADHRGPIVFLDLHTTSAEGTPFAIVADTLLNRRLAFEHFGPGNPRTGRATGRHHAELHERSRLCRGRFEGGQNDALSSIDHNEAALWTILMAAGCVDGNAMAQAARARAALAARTRGVPRILEVRYRHAIEPADEFAMVPGYVSFQPVKRGEVLGRDRRGPVRAPENGRILLPLYQSQGSDGFFLVREISPRWLQVSAWMRRMRMERALPILPGVRRDPKRPDTLIVDPQVGALAGARFLPSAGLSPAPLRERQNRRQQAASRRRFAGAMVASNHLIEQRIVDYPAAPLARPDHVDKVGVPADVGDMVGVMREHGL